ncbi:MAG: hypothetical protein V1649_04550 [Patescibacteria group bacterium]
MEQQFATTPGVKIKAPLLVKIIAWLMLLGGIGQLFSVLLFLLISPIFGTLQLLVAVGLIITSFGLHGMKKWALYVFTVITTLALGAATYSFLTSSKKEVIEFMFAGIQILVLIYFWVISKKFV